MSLAPFAAIEQRIAAATLSRLANAVVVPEVGPPFAAEFDLADIDPIMAASITADAQIVYRAGAADLMPGDTVSIGGTTYRVASDPERNGQALTVRLREIA